jgi:hypothetical protein
MTAARRYACHRESSSHIGRIPIPKNLEPLAETHQTEQHQAEIQTRRPYAPGPPRLLVSRSPNGGGGEGTEVAKSCSVVRPYLPRNYLG